MIMGMLFSLLTASAAAQNTAESYLASGRAVLFDGTLTGLREAAEIFEAGYFDPECEDCPGNRELAFFHAISRIAMWVAKDDGGAAESGIELAREAGIDVQEDVIRSIDFSEWNFPEDRYGRPILPTNIEGLLADLETYRDAVAIPELGYVIDVLDSISETPENPFEIFLTPSETQVFLDPEMPPYSYDIKVDFGDVLMLKGMLSMMKGLLTTQTAYDLHVSEEAMLVEKVYENLFSIQQDLLLPHPDFLKLLPTENDPADGTVILAQVRQDILQGLAYYRDALDYLIDASRSAEPSELEHHLFFIAPEDLYIAERMREHLDRLLGSLLGDTPFPVEGQTTKEFELSNSTGGMFLELTEDAFGRFQDGYLEVFGEDYSLYFWDIRFEVIENHLYGYADYGEYWGWDSWFWVSGYFEGTLNENRTAISDAFLDYWGETYGTVGDLSGQVEWEDSEEPFWVDLNPVFGGTTRYPDPTSPRDLLPEFGDWNKPVPGTIAQGLGVDVTLGGILPEATEQTWQEWIDPQPTGKLPWPLLEWWQMVDGWPFWLDEQLIFTDRLGDVERELSERPGLDICALYMGLGWNDLYGSILLEDVPANEGIFVYTLSLSPSPRSPSALGTFRVVITVQDGIGDAQSYLCEEEYGDSVWSYIGMVNVRVDANWISFKISFDDLPCSIFGRYLSLDSQWGYDEWWLQEADLNHTHIQIGQTGTLSGEVMFAGYRGGPVFVRAFTDLKHPDESLIAYKVLSEPGTFILENVGLGLRCYIEAFSPLFGEYHPLDMNAFKSTTKRLVMTQAQTIRGIVLDLDVPIVLQNGRWQFGRIDFPLKREQYFAFDAIAGAEYIFELDCFDVSDAYMMVLDRNGNDVLVSGHPGYPEPIWWTCPVNGRYYLRISEPDWSDESGDFSVLMTTELYCPRADISGSQWVGVRDCRVDFYDFGLLARYWMQDCSEPYWCEDSDYSQSGIVNIADLSVLLDDWLKDGLLD
jgi:hypothetical protein